MLLCGNQVEDFNLYNWEIDRISSSLKCSYKPYWDLINLCFDIDVSANFIEIYTVSMIAYIGRKSNYNQDSEFVLDMLTSLFNQDYSMEKFPGKTKYQLQLTEGMPYQSI